MSGQLWLLDVQMDGKNNWTGKHSSFVSPISTVSSNNGELVLQKYISSHT